MNAAVPQTTLALPTAKLLIDGAFVESQSAEWGDIVNPATQEVIGRVPFATLDEVDAAIASAQRAFQTWKTTPVGARLRIMLKFQDLVRRNLERIAHTLTAEQGKTLPDAQGDIFRGLEVVEHACSIGTLQQGEFAENVAGGVDTYTLRQPIGVCAGITPFNFPGMIPLWMFPMAIVCGNTFVLKPSEQDPLSTMQLVELAIEAGVPQGVLNVVHGGKTVVDRLCTHPDIKAISFVGSTRVGTHVYNLGSQHGKRVQSMMGAKNHAVVLPDAHRSRSTRSSARASARPASAAWRRRSSCWSARRATGCRARREGEGAEGQCGRGSRHGRRAGRVEGREGTHPVADRRRREGRRETRTRRPQREGARLRAGQLRRPDDLRA